MIHIDKNLQIFTMGAGEVDVNLPSVTACSEKFDGHTLAAEKSKLIQTQSQVTDDALGTHLMVAAHDSPANFFPSAPSQHTNSTAEQITLPAAEITAVTGAIPRPTEDLGRTTLAVTETPEREKEDARQQIVEGFLKLRLTDDKSKITKLQQLIEKLWVKSPQMLERILNNCKWLSGKAQDDFIYDVAVTSMEMELADIFENEANAFSGRLEPGPAIAINHPHKYKLFAGAGDSVVKNMQERFNEWLNTNKNALFETSFPNTTPQKEYQDMIGNWVTSAWLYPIRKAVENNVLAHRVMQRQYYEEYLKECQNADRAYSKEQINEDLQYEKECVAKAGKLLAVSYSLTQMVYRHMETPSYVEGSPPTVLAVRKVKKCALDKMVGKAPAQIDNNTRNKKWECYYNAENANPAESWGQLGIALYHAGANCATGTNAAIYGEIPVYELLLSCYGSLLGHASGSLKEIVRIPFSDVKVIAETLLNESAYLKNIVLKTIEAQYGSDNETLKEAKAIEAQYTRRDNEAENYVDPIVEDYEPSQFEEFKFDFAPTSAGMSSHNEGPSFSFAKFEEFKFDFAPTSAGMSSHDEGSSGSFAKIDGN
ncbi:MAG: hypothetical protein LBI61_03145 [Puniceicoccales bacterium]|jgi:hypothetical protein|nr:hypothetical protein [Puniceicoccales bacterium]